MSTHGGDVQFSKETHTRTQTHLEGKLSSTNQSWKDKYQPRDSMYRLVKLTETGSKSVSLGERGDGKSYLAAGEEENILEVWRRVTARLYNS